MTPPFEEKADNVRLVPIVAPPERVTAVLVEAPRPVTVERVSDSEVSAPLVELIVIVDPDDEMLVPPVPAIVKAPGRVLTLVTMALVFKATTGFWPPVTEIPVPPVTP